MLKDQRYVVSLLMGCDESGSGFTNEKTGSGLKGSQGSLAFLGLGDVPLFIISL